jgi:hypothetical protein
MNGEYFHARVCVQLARFARDIARGLLGNNTYHGTAIDDACDALESGAESADPFVVATRALVDSFWNEVAVECAADCMTHPKSARKSTEPVIDRWNMQIRHGYPNDVFILCGGLERE